MRDAHCHLFCLATSRIRTQLSQHVPKRGEMYSAMVMLYIELQKYLSLYSSTLDLTYEVKGQTVRFNLMVFSSMLDESFRNYRNVCT